MAMKIRALRYDEKYAYVPLTCGYETIIDLEDADKVNGFNWRAHKQLSNVYAVREVRLPCGKRTSLYVHRLVMGDPSGLVIDHINGDGLDNRKENLRAVRHQQNIHNTKPPKNNSSGYKGVSFDKTRNKWQAKITFNRKQLHLGRFDTIEEAVEAYDKAFTRLNGWEQYRR